MKISNEQLRALQDAEARRVKTNKNTGEFGALFTRQLDAEQPQGAAGLENAAAPAPGLRSMSLSGLLEDSASDSALTTVEEAAGQMENMFSTFESYADELALDDKANLRQAYGLLEKMNGQIAEFKSRFPNAGNEQPELATMLNELDVLVTTETFKFNRGDYA